MATAEIRARDREPQLISLSRQLLSPWASHWTRRSTTPGPVGFNASSNAIDGANANPFHYCQTRPCVSPTSKNFEPPSPPTSIPRHGVTSAYLRIRKDSGITSKGQLRDSTEAVTVWRSSGLRTGSETRSADREDVEMLSLVCLLSILLGLSKIYGCRRMD